MAVRVTDIAEKLNIAKPSVTAAVNTLGKKVLLHKSVTARSF